MPRYAPDLPDIDERIREPLNQYEQQIAELIDLAHSGGLTKRQFTDRLDELVGAFLLLLFLLGGGDRSNRRGARELEQKVRQHHQSVRKLADDIYSGRYQADEDETRQEAEEKLGNRLLLWMFGAAAAYELGHVYHVNQARRYRWDLGNTEEHCTDCLRLNGQVHTAAEWAASNWRPQGNNLECGGWRCDCSLNETDEPTSGNF